MLGNMLTTELRKEARFNPFTADRSIQDNRQKYQIYRKFCLDLFALNTVNIFNEELQRRCDNAR